MPLHGFDGCRRRALRNGLIGIALGLSTALPAQAFNAFSGPILAASAVAPNVVILFDSSSSMVLNRVAQETRLAIARDVTKDVIAANRDVRFGLFSFREPLPGDPGPGGILRVEVGSIDSSPAGVRRFEQINQALDNLNPSTSNYTWTPLAESYYEITRYMRGLRAFYPQSVAESSRDPFQSPIEYRCQKNFGLIVTDGLPTYDRQFPTSLAVEPDGDNPQVAGAFNLPDWDGDGSDVTPGARENTEGGTFYLDDIARFAYEIDMRTRGTDRAGKSWDDPQFSHQSLQTYTVGFALDDARLQDTASAGNGRYFTATDRQQLKDALGSALQEIIASAGSGGGAVTDNQKLVAGSSRYYQTQYDPSDWSGALRAYSLGETGEPDRLLWSSDQSFRPGSAAGRFETWRTAEGASAAAAVELGAHSWSALAAGQQTALDAEAALAGLSGDNRGQLLLNWARGSNVTHLRSRSRLLGDVINSSPVLVSGKQRLAQAHDADYQNYLAYKQQGMEEVVVLGANDGFLRVFDTAGMHRYSFMPAALHRGLGARAREDYGNGNHHRSGVDGRIVTADARLGTTWSTVAASGLGAGGKGLFAVRLFDHSTGNNALGALWEANANQDGFAAMGHIYGRPVIATLHGSSVLITGNGYGSADDTAALMIFDLASGRLLRQLDVGNRVGVATGNGLSAPALHYDAAGNIQAVFAGDLHGQLWKFDLSDSDASGWRVAHNGDPLFIAEADQPITIQPQVHHSVTAGGNLVLFGTGKFMEATDLTDTSVQAFYAVLDVAAPPAGGLTPAALQQQNISSINTDTDSGQRMRTLTANTVDWSSQYGWRLPLSYHGEPPGERVTRDFVIRGARVLFTTGFIKTGENDPCLTQAGGWLMAVGLDNGAMLTDAILDTNRDRVINDDDQPAAGLELNIGLPGDLNVLDEDDSQTQVGCAGEVYVVQGSSDVAVVSGQPQCLFSRIMWRQLQ